MDKVFREVKCPICGKMFIPAIKNVYKVSVGVKYNKKRKDVCSYTCWRKAGGGKETDKLRGENIL